MHSSKHIFFNAIIGSVMLYILGYPIFSYELLMIVSFGFFIDIDHLFNEIFKGDLFYPEKTVKKWILITEEYTGELYLFHSYEFMGFVLLLGLWSPLFVFAFVGLAVHFICDAFTNFKETRSFEFLEDFSIIYYVYKWRHYHVFKKFFTEFFKIIQPRPFLRLWILYLNYIYAHPDTILGWLFSKMHPRHILNKLVEKLES